VCAGVNVKIPPKVVSKAIVEAEVTGTTVCAILLNDAIDEPNNEASSQLTDP